MNYKVIEPKDLKVGMEIAYPYGKHHIGWLFGTVDFITPDNKRCTFLAGDGVAPIAVNLEERNIFEPVQAMCNENESICEKLLGERLWNEKGVGLTDEIIAQLTAMLIRTDDILWE